MAHGTRRQLFSPLPISLCLHLSFFLSHSLLRLRKQMPHQNSRDFAEDMESWPTTADDYELLETIGQGATAQVRFWFSFKVFVEVKIFHPFRSETDHVRPAPVRLPLAFLLVCLLQERALRCYQSAATANWGIDED